MTVSYEQWCRQRPARATYLAVFVTMRSNIRSADAEAYITAAILAFASRSAETWDTLVTFTSQSHVDPEATESTNFRQFGHPVR